MGCVLWLVRVTFDVLNFLCSFVGVVALVHVCGFVGVSWCKHHLWLPSVVCVLVCEREGEVSLFLRITIDASVLGVVLK